MVFDFIYCVITPQQPNYPYLNFKSRLKSLISNAKYRHRGSAFLKLPLKVRLQIYQEVFTSNVCDFRYAGSPGEARYYARLFRGHPDPPHCVMLNMYSQRWNPRRLLFVCSQIYREALVCFYSNIRITVQTSWPTFLQITTNPHLKFHLRRIVMSPSVTDYSFFKDLPMLREVLITPYILSAPPDLPPKKALEHGSMMQAFYNEIPERGVCRVGEATRLKKLMKDFPHIDFSAQLCYSYYFEDPDINLGSKCSTIFLYHVKSDVFTEQIRANEDHPPRVVLPAEG